MRLKRSRMERRVLTNNQMNKLSIVQKRNQEPLKRNSQQITREVHLKIRQNEDSSLKACRTAEK